MPQTALAQSSGSSKAAAEALFVDGRNLMAAGKYAEACKKFEASQKLDPGLGTMLNLADCYEKTGRTASAWAEYREAIPLARAAGSREREELASSRAKALESRLSTLTIRAMGGGADGAALEIRRDGVSVDDAELGTPIPVDPGVHTIEAAAPGKKPWSTQVEVGTEAAKVSVEVPELEAHGSPAAADATASRELEPPAAARDDRTGSSQRLVGLGVGAVGVVGLGLGAYFGLKASSEWDDAKKECADFPYECTERGIELKDNASSKATLSTIGFIAGAALVGVGTVLYFTAPSGERVAVGVTPGGAFVSGKF